MTVFDVNFTKPQPSAFRNVPKRSAFRNGLKYHNFISILISNNFSYKFYN